MPSRELDTAQMLSKRLRTMWDPGPTHARVLSVVPLSTPVFLRQSPPCSQNQVAPYRCPSAQGQRWSSDSLPPVHPPKGSCSSLHRGNASVKRDGFAPKGSMCSGPLPRKVVTTGPRATSALTLGGPHPAGLGSLAMRLAPAVPSVTGPHSQ